MPPDPGGPGTGGSRCAELASRYGERTVDALDALVVYCDEAAALTARGRAAYERDVLLQRAAEAIFNRIGETVRNSLPGDLLERYPDQPWRLIVGMRVRMAHRYAENDTAIMWNTLVRNVPMLRGYVASVILGED